MNPHVPLSDHSWDTLKASGDTSNSYGHGAVEGGTGNGIIGLIG